MKKIVCAIVIAAAAGFAFAQELKLDGYVNSGLGFVVTNRDGDDPVLRAYGVDSERLFGRFRLNGAYTNADKTAGANFRFQVQGANGVNNVTGNTAGIPTLAFGYGWLKPIDMLTLKAGIVDDTTWETAGAIFKDDNGEGVGILAKLSPIEGLDLGAGAYIAALQSGGNNNALAQGLGREIEWWNIKYTFNAAYTMPGAFRLAASLRTPNKSVTTNRDNTAQLIGEFRLLAVKDLSVILEAAADKLYPLKASNPNQDFSDVGTLAFYETVAYKMDDLRFGLNAAQYKSNVKDQDDLGLLFNPWISYTFGKIVPRLDLAYFMAGGAGGGTDASNATSPIEYHRRAYAASYNNDDYAFIVRPSVKINVDVRAVLEIGDAVFYQKVLNGGNRFAKNDDPLLTNVFYVDLTVRF